jgi:hypothetical protein
MSNKYDPNIKYTWDNDTKFELSGREFGFILNTFRTVLSSPEAQKILLLNSANNIAEDILQRNVESGNVKPAEIPEGNQTPGPKLVKN